MGQPALLLLPEELVPPQVGMQRGFSENEWHPRQRRRPTVNKRKRTSEVEQVGHTISCNGSVSFSGVISVL
jgi:hypothetical protein